MKRVLLALVLFALSAVPASADSFTIDSTNCSDNCYGLSWTLTINEGSYSYLGQTYEYQAILTVSDDTNVDGVPNRTISAVDFKVSSSVSSAVLYQAPTSGWQTYVNVLNSSGCTGPDAGFVCSQNGTSPALFTGSTLTWAWYFNTSDPIFADLIGGHIGAKVTTLSRPGRLLSETYNPVPEPTTFAMLGMGGLMLLMARRKRFGLF
jgi:hypothetical protein